MKLTKVERLLLINQFQIRKKLEGTDQYDQMIIILENGYSKYYDNAVNAVYDEVPEGDCDFVHEAFDMFQSIERYKQTSGDDLKGISCPYFTGFDSHNGEGQLLSFTLFEFKKKGQWDDLKRYATATRNFSSGFPMRQTYERMLLAFNPLGKRKELTKEDVMTVFARV
jgi:uncharacterized protein YfbU (UPF0304 family)